MPIWFEAWPMGCGERVTWTEPLDFRPSGSTPLPVSTGRWKKQSIRRNMIFWQVLPMCTAFIQTCPHADCFISLTGPMSWSRMPDLSARSKGGRKSRWFHQITIQHGLTWPKKWDPFDEGVTFRHRISMCNIMSRNVLKLLYNLICCISPLWSILSFDAVPRCHETSGMKNSLSFWRLSKDRISQLFGALAVFKAPEATARWSSRRSGKKVLWLHP
jgi:hypothetical protein